jgi:hypothetical protein
MKYTLLIVAVIALAACSEASFINHKLEFKKNGECTTQERNIKMLSNIVGERYEFNVCADDSFDGKNYQVERVGDSIVVSFPKTSSQKSSFTITLDIDAKPVYKHIILDGQDIPITQQQ